MIKFKYIDIEGFGSIIAPLKFKLNRKGLNIIKGSNGIGKTTIFSALAWVIYGKTLKDKSNIEPWLHIRPKNFSGTKCEIQFYKNGVKIQIIRCLKYKPKVEDSRGGNRVILIVDGEIQHQHRDKKDIQKAIENIMGFSFDLFKSSIIFGQKMKRIIEETGPNKKAIFEEAFEVSYINQAKDEAMADKKAIAEDLQDIINRIDILEATRDAKEASLEKLVNAAADWNENKAENLTYIKKNIKVKKSELKKLKEFEPSKTIDKRISDHKAWLKPKEKEADKITNYIIEKSKLENEIDILTSSIVRLTKDSSIFEDSLITTPTSCSTCQQPLDKKAVQETKASIRVDINKVQEKIRENESNRNITQKALVKINKQITSNKELVDKVNSKKESLRKLEDDKIKQDIAIKFTNSSIQNISKEIAKLNNDYKIEKNRKLSFNTSDLDKEINSLLTELKPLNRTQKKLTRQYDLKTWLISDPLSNSGIKAFIFNQMMDMVNERLSIYSGMLGFGVRFSVNMDSAKKDFYSTITRNEEEIPYEDLSGGQKQLVDIATAFSIHDVVNVERPCNILVMDEIFESLSEENVEIVTELITLKTQSVSTYLITHQSSFNPNNANHILLHFKKGRTSLL